MSASLASEMNEPITYLANNTTTLRRDVMSFMRLIAKYREGSEALAKVMPEFAAEMAQIEEELNVDYFQYQLPRQFKTSLDELQRVQEVLNKLRDFAQMNETEIKKSISTPPWIQFLKSLIMRSKRKVFTSKPNTVKSRLWFATLERSTRRFSTWWSIPFRHANLKTRSESRHALSRKEPNPSRRWSNWKTRGPGSQRKTCLASSIPSSRQSPVRQADWVCLWLTGSSAVMAVLSRPKARGAAVSFASGFL